MPAVVNDPAAWAKLVGAARSGKEGFFAFYSSVADAITTNVGCTAARKQRGGAPWAAGATVRTQPAGGSRRRGRRRARHDCRRIGRPSPSATPRGSVASRCCRPPPQDVLSDSDS